MSARRWGQTLVGSALVAYALACVGCADEYALPRCVPNALAECSCPSGALGAQRCDATGRFGPCVCEAVRGDSAVAAVDAVTEAAAPFDAAIADAPALDAPAPDATAEAAVPDASLASDGAEDAPATGDVTADAGGA